jgi:hypothetical protein
MEGQWAELKSYSHREKPDKHFIVKRKSYSLFLWVMLKKGVVDVGDDEDE